MLLMQKRIDWRASLLSGLIASSTVASAGVVILNDDFSSNSLTEDGTFLRDETGWQTATDSAWGYGAGLQRVFNTGTEVGHKTSGAMAQTVKLGDLGLSSEQKLTVSFTYETFGGSAAADDLYVHVWGLKDIASTGTTSMGNLGAQGGNFWQPAADKFTTYNLGTGEIHDTSNNAFASTAAIKLIDMGVDVSPTLYTTTFDLGEAMSEYDYFTISFHKVYGGTDQGFGIRDVNVTATAVPEPSGMLLLSLGSASLMMRRKR